MKAFAGALAAYSVDVAIMLVALTAVYVLFVRQVRSARLQSLLHTLSPYFVPLSSLSLHFGVLDSLFFS